MKKLVLIFFIFSTVSVFSQNTDDAISNPDIMPEFPGGSEALMKFIRSNIKPISQIKPDTLFAGCRSMVSFVIDKEGIVKNVFIARSCINCNACDTEAIKVMEKMPKWKPGLQNNKPVPVKMAFPIFFEAK